MSIIIAIIAAVTSSGFCSVVLYLLQRRDKKNDKQSNQTKLLLGIAHDRIMYLGTAYIRRGTITPDEYENLHDYLYVPYKAEGGNGACERVMKEVEKLPIKEEKS